MKLSWGIAALTAWMMGIATGFADEPMPVDDIEAEAPFEAPVDAARGDGQPMDSDLSPEDMVYLAQARQIWDSLDRRSGEIKLPNGVATLKVPDNFYYLGPADSRTVLVDVWGNPPANAEGIQGMLFPADSTPFDADAWGVTIEYEQDGHVSDDDADDIDYDELLAAMQDDVRAESAERVKAGYEAIALVGWAAKPHYDRASHKLYWAKELEFGKEEEHTVNYNIRVLGRKGVLVLNFIAGMPQLPVVNANLDTVLAMADFDSGSRYDEFNPELDKVAAYGIGALVAGKVLAKTGLIAAALVLLKKFGVVIVAALIGLVRVLRRRKPAVDTSPRD